jgi:Fic family protein
MDYSIWTPNYILTNKIVNHLTAIEAARVIVDNASLPPGAIADLSRQARIRATHYSTRIEGNRLTLEEAEEVITGRRRVFHGRERDVSEVKNYWEALTYIEDLVAQKRPIAENTIQRLAGIVINGKRNGLLPYRTGQNVIRDSSSGSIVYMPPEAHDVPILMLEMVKWIHEAILDKIPPVIIAGLAHYQFVTIHPYYDGNGRTARLLAALILQRCGYGLGGIFSLEEYHSKDIEAYYGALDVGGHHNYYMGRADADLTSWIEYFTDTLAQVFENAKKQALDYSSITTTKAHVHIPKLDHRAQVVLTLFNRQEFITSNDVAAALGLSERMARVLLSKWVVDGWLVVADASRRSRKYALLPIPPNHS